MKQPISFDHILDRCCDFFLVKRTEVVNTCRRGHLVNARHVCMYLSRKHTGLSFEEIGRRLCRDHTSVMHGCRSIPNRMALDERLRGQVDWIERNLMTEDYGQELIE